LGIARLGLLGILMIFVLGNQRCPIDDQRPPALNCQDFPIVIVPGTCVTFANPCAAISGRALQTQTASDSTTPTVLAKNRFGQTDAPHR